MRLPSRVILCFASAVFALFGVLEGADLTFTPPKGLCVLSGSPRSEKPIVVAALARLNSRFSNACTLLSDQMEDPFSSSSQGVWRVHSLTASMGYWIDISSDGSEVTFRGIDLSSNLSWGQARAATTGISETSRVNVVKSVVDRVIEQFPFVGFVDGTKFFAWTKLGSMKVHAVRRKNSERHPFLPFLLESETEVVAGNGGVLTRLEDERGWKMSPGKDFQASSERLWLQSSVGDRP